MFASKIRMHSTYINRLFRRNWQYHPSFSSRKKYLLTIYLQSFKPFFLKSYYLWSYCFVIVLWLWSGVFWWFCIMYRLCSSAILLFLLFCHCPRGLLQFWWFWNSSFIFQTCCFIYLDMLHIVCLYSLVFLQEIPPVRMWSVRKLGRAIIKTILEADFCFHVNAVLTAWSSLI